MGIGFTVAAGRPLILGVIFAAYFLGIYLPVMRVEASTLAGKFGEDYRLYAQAVPLFLPRLTAYKDESLGETQFDSSLYMRYREYRAALGVAIAWGALVLRALW